MALDGISFLPADVSSSAFGREFPARSETLALDPEQTAEFAELVEETLIDHRDDFASGFVAE